MNLVLPRILQFTLHAPGTVIILKHKSYRVTSLLDSHAPQEEAAGLSMLIGPLALLPFPSPLPMPHPCCSAVGHILQFLELPTVSSFIQAQACAIPSSWKTVIRLSSIRLASTCLHFRLQPRNQSLGGSGPGWASAGCSVASFAFPNPSVVLVSKTPAAEANLKP